MANVKLRNVTKRFGSVVAVNNVSLDIPYGKVTAVLGPSGCGKTTLLLMLAGIYKPTEGEILFDQLQVNGIPPQLRNVGLVFQSYALYPHMTAFDNIAFPLRLQKTPKEEIKRRVEEMAEIVQIGDLLQRRPGQLSGGQQQRVALCRALVKNPDLLLLDEPLSNLDARLRIETRAEIKRIQQELGITTILVTHDQVEAVTMADQVAVLKAGVLQQYGTPAELWHRPANLFVASFIGDPPMNLLRAQLVFQDGRSFFQCGTSLRLPVPFDLAQELQQKGRQELVVGIRPEHLSLSRERSKLGFRGKVFLVELLGRDKLVDFRFGSQALRVLVPATLPVERGEVFWIEPQPGQLHLFDPATQQRLELEESRLKAWSGHAPA
ncbi:MAG TPA: ABC transporter ATP-binding protein [Limnochordia bacterium]|nr:ABC transporter ATP-binding protein [Limnochordia bacterium]